MNETDTLAINIEGCSYTIFCGLCDTPITFIGIPDADAADAGCAGCDNTDNVEEVARIALKFASDEAQMIVNRQMQKAARNTKGMTFSGKTRQNGPHRFIVHLEG